MDEVSALFYAILTGVFIFMFAIMLVFHIFKAIGMQKVAKARGLKNGWLAWIPLINSYTLGEIADDINIKKGKTTYFSWINLTYSVISSAISAFVALPSIRVLMNVIVEIPRMIQDDLDTEAYINENLSPYTGMSWLNILIALAGKALLIFIIYYISKEYSPEASVVITVVSAIFGDIVVTFYLFSIRNKQPAVVDYGYNNGYQAPFYGYPGNQPPPFGNNNGSANGWNGTGSVLDSGADVFASPPNFNGQPPANQSTQQDAPPSSGINQPQNPDNIPPQGK